MGGDEDDASDCAVAEVGRARGLSVTLSPSMLPLFTRDSISSERRSADSLSTWIILKGCTRYYSYLFPKHYVVTIKAIHSHNKDPHAKYKSHKTMDKIRFVQQRRCYFERAWLLYRIISSYLPGACSDVSLENLV